MNQEAIAALKGEAGLEHTARNLPPTKKKLAIDARRPVNRLVPVTRERETRALSASVGHRPGGFVPSG